MWGQGLEEPDKMHNVLDRLLQTRFSDRKVNVLSLAHSGSSTGYRRDGSIDPHHKPRIHGEVPTSYPTIVQQVEEFNGQGIEHDAVDLILLDAGANDVRLENILDPLVFPRRIKHLVEIYCHQHMVLLLELLTATFKNAKIIVVGYYEMLTEQSEDDYIRVLLKALGKVPVGVPADLLIVAFRPLFKRRLLTNCDTFASASLAALQQSADEVNSHLTGKRVFVLPPAIGNEHAAFSVDPWLFGINDDLSAEDPLAHIRAEECKCAGPSRTEVLTCKKASMGHPNPEGAKAYAEAMLALITGKMELMK